MSNKNNDEGMMLDSIIDKNSKSKSSRELLMPKKTLSDDDCEEITIGLKDTLKPGESEDSKRYNLRKAKERFIKSE